MKGNIKNIRIFSVIVVENHTPFTRSGVILICSDSKSNTLPIKRPSCLCLLTFRGAYIERSFRVISSRQGKSAISCAKIDFSTRTKR